MALRSTGIYSIKGYSCRFISVVLRWLIEPAAVLDEKQRRRVRLLSAFLLLIAINTLTGAMVMRNAAYTSWYFLLVTSAIFALGYCFSRTRYFRLATIIAVTIPAIPVINMTLFDPDRTQFPSQLPWLAIPLLVSSVLISLRYTVIVAVTYIIVTATLLSFIGLPASHMGDSLAFMVTISFFVITATTIRQQDQSDIEHELTERAHAEEALRESEEKYRAIFEQASDSIVLIDIETGAIVDFNDKAHQALGYSRDEFARLRLTDIDAIESEEEIKKHAETINKKGMGSFDTKQRTKDGDIRDVLVSARSLNVNGKSFNIAVWHDITERKRMEEALRNSLQFNVSLLENSPNPITVLNADFSINYVNPAFEKLTGFTSAEVIGLKTPYPWWPDDEEKKLGAHIGESLLHGGETIETTFRKKSGEHFSIRLSVSAITHNGILKHHMANWEDITEYKVAEEKVKKALSNLERSNMQLAALNKELEAFSYSVSHDLRAPLRTIDGFSLAMLEDYQDKLDERGRDYLQRVRKASQHMGELIDALLKLSRLSRSEIHQEPIDLSALAEEIAAELQQTKPEKQVEFVISQGLTAHGDRQLIKIALENLLSNAWKFTGGRPQPRIEFGITRNGGKKTYYVRDNGAGFDMKYADKLFAPFQRLHSATDFPGIGIGLVTVQRIIHRHGGNIHAEGAVGQGAAFYFTLN